MSIWYQLEKEIQVHKERGDGGEAGERPKGREMPAGI